jgi:LysR family hydrogen peroxide-inducible transcriptional activator
MKPSFRQLEYIVAVADLGGIGLAASTLNVSQPSLSAQLAEVEADLGVRLFDRGRAGAKPTPAGEEVVRRARTILREVQDLRAVAKGGALFQGRLRLGVLLSIGPYLLPDVVKRLHNENPDLRLILREESTRDLDEGLQSGRFDAIISTPEDHAAGQADPLFSEALWAALPDDHHLAGDETPIPLDALAGETFLTLGAGHRLSHIVTGLAARAGGRVSDEYEGTSLDAIRLMAVSGAGVAILPSIYAATEARRGMGLTLRRIEDPGAHRSIALIQRITPEPILGTEQLAQVLRQEAKQILAPFV